MAEPHSGESSSAVANRNTSEATSSSSRSSRVRRDEESPSGGGGGGGGNPNPQSQTPDGEPQNLSVVYRGVVRSISDATSVARDDSWSCVVVLFTFWFFVSMTMILGVYGSVELLIGPNSSILFQPNPIFVQSIKVQNLDSNPGVMLYGTYGVPALDDFTVWTEHRNVTVPSDSHEEWKYYLNTGSQINISYQLSSENSSVFLVIANGNDGLAQWLEEPTYPNSTLSWNIISGTGMITQDIFSSSSYYVALGNLDEDMEVEMSITIMAALYNTTKAYYKCTLDGSNSCSLSIFFPDGNSAVLTSPGPQQNTSSNEWYIKLSYGPRWVTYIFGMGGMTLLMFSAFNYLNKLLSANEHRARIRYEETAPQRDPLLSNKDDDLSSWGSSYDSLSHDEEDLNFTGGGKSLGDPETSNNNNNNTRRLCAICFDAPRDCFFLPCGHCVACFECATRIAEAEGTCAVCHRRMKKVRKIFTV